MIDFFPSRQKDYHKQFAGVIYEGDFYCKSTLTSQAGRISTSFRFDHAMQLGNINNKKYKDNKSAVYKNNEENLEE